MNNLNINKNNFSFVVNRTNSKDIDLVINVLILIGIIICIFLLGFSIFYILSWDLGFIDPSSVFAESLIKLYNFIWFFLIVILVLVVILMLRIIYLFSWFEVFNFEILNNFIGNLLNFNLLGSLFLNDKIMTKLLIKKLINFELLFFNLSIWYDDYKKDEFLQISDLSEYKQLELVWCVLPVGVLLTLVGPSFSLVFSLDPCIDPAFTVKVIGHQWYWSYAIEGIFLIENEDLKNQIDKKNLVSAGEYFSKNLYDTNIFGEKILNVQLFEKRLEELKYWNENNYYSFNVNFDSVMIAEEDLFFGSHRLLEVDNRLVLPTGVPIKFIITSTDVLHSWAVPSLGIKVDAVPGRLNQFVLEIKKPGIFYGQCSELCGPMHGFMPIVIQAVDLEEFEQWLVKKTNQ